MAYRRVVRRSTRLHRALDRPRLRPGAAPSFPLAFETKALDRLSFAGGRDTWPEGSFDWRTGDMWRPLRIQPYYFDYLNDPARSEAWKRAILTDWIEHHPLGRGDAWTAYPVSLRIVNWIKFFCRLAPAEIDARWLTSLYDHALWLERNLELHILANHYLKNAKALVFAGLFFNGADAERWKARGLEIFLEQLQEQFLSDGGHYERSPMYHAISLEDILDVFTYVNAGVIPATAALLETLRSFALNGLDFLGAMLMPDGSLPLFNDAAQNVGPSSAELFAYARTTLGYESPRAVRGLTVRALAASGYYVIRDAASMLVIDCGPLGPAYQPGHAHCDCLSYELALAGERVVVDAGVFDYEDNAARRYARGTAAHNVVQIDGLEQSDMWSVFRVARRACPIDPSLTLTGAAEATFAGGHDGFERSKARAIDRRTVTYAAGVWTFQDRIDGHGSHRIENRVHVRPGLVTQRVGEVVEIGTSGGQPLAILRPLVPVDVRVEKMPYYPSFGVCEEADVVVMTLQGTLPTLLSYAIEPAAANA